MTAGLLTVSLQVLPRAPFRLLGLLTCLGLTGLAAVVVAVMGLWSLLLPIYAALLFTAIFRPQTAAAILLVTAITVEPTASDLNKYLSMATWSLPPGFQNAFGVTTSPIEILTFVAAAASLSRPSQIKTPLIAWGIPAVVALGLLYGVMKGGATNLAYHEARGFIAAIAAFVLASRTLPADLAGLAKLVMASTGTLAAMTLIRYFVFVRTGTLDVPMEFAFAHEGSVIMGLGFLLGVVVAVQHTHSLRAFIGLSLYCLLMVAAMIATGRRAATLTLLVGTLTFGALLLPRRTLLVALAAVPLSIAITGYLAMYWNDEYGALAQPARAIRSQFDPTLRDESSDSYRTTEKYNVIETIRINRVFGVGFGNPFYQFQPLPDLRSFWPLQQYTPHQSILWLWLKMGIVGISVVLGFGVLVLSRAFAVLRRPRTNLEWTIAATAVSTLLMFLIYATVDLGFTSARSLAPVVVFSVIVFRLSPAPGGPPK
jgi:hypothetical protein